LHHRSKLPLKIVLEDLGSGHGLVHGDSRNIPSANVEIVGVDHGEHLRYRNKDVLTSLGIGTESDGGCSDKRTNVVGLLKSVLGVPGDVVLVGEVGSENSRTIVSSESDQEKAVISSKLALG
jgi:hypothetical protein